MWRIWKSYVQPYTPPADGQFSKVVCRSLTLLCVHVCTYGVWVYACACACACECVLVCVHVWQLCLYG